jgi:carbamoyl-phosphate synthase large subunit
VLPPYSLSPRNIDEIAQATRDMAVELGVLGLMNVQYAVKDGQLYVLEVNPRASRTVPFVSKATGIALAKLATKVMLGRSLRSLGLTEERIPTHISVKEAVLPFDRFPGVDTLLGPEMKSTGEVMGIDQGFGAAYAKAQLGAGNRLPDGGTVFISVRDRDKQACLDAARRFQDMGFALMATAGTARFLGNHGMQARLVNKVSYGRPHVVDAIKNGQVQLVINTGGGDDTRRDGYEIRRAAIKYHIPYATTIPGAVAMSRAIVAMKTTQLSVKPLQEYHVK